MKAKKGKQLNLTDLSEYRGVVSNTILAWVRRGCPFVRRAKGAGRGAQSWLFDTAAVMEWEIQQAIENAVGDLSKVDFEEAKRRKTAAEAALAEYELAERRRETLRVDDVAATVAQEYAGCRARLLAIPSKLAPQLVGVDDPEQARAAVEAAIQDALAELVSDGASDSEDPGDGAGGAEERVPEAAADSGGNDEASAPADPQSVGGRQSRSQQRSRRRTRPMADQ